MIRDSDKVSDADSYIAGFPVDVQTILKTIRKTIWAAAPEAKETISHQIPTFTLNGRNLIHFTGFRGHVGI